LEYCVQGVSMDADVRLSASTMNHHEQRVKHSFEIALMSQQLNHV